MKIGIDMGSNSIGWALLNNDQILASGVRVFPEGINLEKGTKEVSKNLKRRQARQIRRQYFRRRMRKIILEKVLKAHGMFPAEHDLAAWRTLNPYVLRSKGTEESLTPLEFGRVMYHLSQRRGFKSSMKGADEEEGKIYDGDLKIRKTGINQTLKGMNSGGFPTLGSYLNSINPHAERIRNRYTTRQMYQQEFKVLWHVQQKFNPEIYSQDLYDQLGHDKTGVLFFQRPLKSQKTLIGKCTFEKNKPRIPISHPMFQEYRAWCMLNNIRFGDNQFLSAEQKKQALDLMSNNQKLNITQLKKKLKLLEEFNFSEDDKLPCLTTLAFFNKHLSNIVLNADEKSIADLWHLFYDAQEPEWLQNKLVEKYSISPQKAMDMVKGRHKVILEEGYGSLSALAIRRILPFLRQGLQLHVAVLLAGVCKVLGDDYWNGLSKSEQETLTNNIRAAAESKSGGTIRERIWNYLVAELGVPKKYTMADLYHHSDTDKQLELLDALPEPKKLRNPIVEQSLFELRSLINTLIQQYGAPDRIVLEMARDLKNTKKQREKALTDNRRREQQRNVVKQKLIDEGIRPNSGNITKYLLWEECQQQCPYTGQSISRSDLFNDGIWQIEHIVPYSVSLDDSFTNKTLCLADENRKKGNKTPWQYLNYSDALWAEAKERAKVLFCNKYSYPKYLKFISEREPKADDFISRQLNDTRYMASEAKRYLETICRDVVVTPGGVTAELRHQWGLDAILSPTPNTPVDVSGPGWLIVSNQGEYIEFVPWEIKLSEASAKTVAKLSKKGIVMYGEMRSGQFFPGKNRNDHRHHAVDAIAIACTERRYVQSIAGQHAQGKLYNPSPIPPPWEHFFEDARDAVQKILVSHKKRKRLMTSRTVKQKHNGKIVMHKTLTPRGQLHDETFYGKVLDPTTKNWEYTTRKPLSSFTKIKQLKAITDSRIMALIKRRAEELQVEWKDDAELPKNFFFENDENGQPIPTLYLPGGNLMASVPVRKVRCRVASSNMALRNQSTQQYAEPGSNYMAAIIETEQGSWREEIVSFWTAAQRFRRKEPLVGLKSGEKILHTLQSNDLYLLNLPHDLDAKVAPPEILSKHLYRVQKISTLFYVFRKHNASTLESDSEMVRIQSFEAWKRVNPIKCRVERDGHLQLL